MVICVSFFSSPFRFASNPFAILFSLGVITPTTGASPELSGVAYLKRPDRVSLCPHSHGEVAGAASFLGLAPRSHPVPTLPD